MSQLLEVPDDGLRCIASFLSPPDLMQFLCTSKRLSNLGHQESFWRFLLLLQLGEESQDSCDYNNDEGMAGSARPDDDNNNTNKNSKQDYLTKAYVNALPQVEWKPILSSLLRGPTGREGHNAVQLGDHRIVITGGFSNDPHVYLFDTTTTTTTTARQDLNDNNSNAKQDWIRVLPTHVPCWRHPKNQETFHQHRNHHHQQQQHHPNEEDEPARVYGASLTPLDDRRAVRFGGFRRGGYSRECSQVALLTIDPPSTRSHRQQRQQQEDETTTTNIRAVWQVIHTHNAGGIMSFGLSRAYHTATLVANRYLVILGGMTSTGCILGEAILDTRTWTWLTETPIVTTTVATTTTQEMEDHRDSNQQPTGRHGHSVVLDEKRNRLVLFGGGSGTDLLRSGSDTADVWELCMGKNQWWKSEHDVEEFQNSLPWQWRPILNDNHRQDDDHNNNYYSDTDDENDNDNHEERDMVDEDDQHYRDMAQRVEDLAGGTSLNDADDRDDDSDEDSDMPGLIHRSGFNQNNNNRSNSRSEAARRRQRRRNSNNLTDEEKLCLGRCHLCVKPGPDTALLVFGSGRPSTNRCLGFNLATNAFFRPTLAGQGVLPPPRFTAAGVLFGQYNSYLLVHGGYSSQRGASIGNMSVLDLAPALRRRLWTFDEDVDFESFPPVTREDLHRFRHFGPTFGHHGRGIGGVEDLLQNLFVELATNAGLGQGVGGGNMRGAPPMAQQMFEEIIGEIQGQPRHRRQWVEEVHNDNDNDGADDDSDNDTSDDNEDTEEEAALMFNVFANIMDRDPGIDENDFPMGMAAAMMGGMGIHLGSDDDDDQDDGEEDENAYDSDNMYEIS